MQIKGFIDEIRDLGGIKFFKMNTSEGYIQITINKNQVDNKILEKFNSLTRQSCIIVEGKKVDNPKAPQGFEILPEDIKILSIAHTPLPLDPSGKTQAELDTRLDWRSLDLRHPRNRAIFKIQSKIVQGMTEYLNENGFMQVFTPCLMGAASEGGSEVFPVAYFDKEAFLRQDPQLHRELTILGGIEKLFDLGPSWRAELSHTTRHLCEHRACAVELAFIKDEYDVMKVEQELMIAAIKKVKQDCEKELELLEVDLQVPKLPFPILEFPKVYDILAEFGKKYEVGEDYDRESEVILWKYVKEKYKADFFFVNRFPFAVKPFYVMRVDEDPTWARSVDMIYKGVELSSGGQREHRYEKLIEQVKEKKINLDSVEWFVKFFKYGAPTLGGFAVGLERLTMQMLDIKNVREAVLFPRTPERLLP
ncbi:MAG: aspartate--tRNA(Asn) ligase [Candidatus Aenigmarchaeota archaeon]|nr:aspartate--tRNA(Asn) ligase [Candidatus Aenigmarchaeota archaeon]MBU5689439.1 aspartate--tRNA(Asn) ligase [Candidatus Aenigmarchaeota archaeon]